MRLSKLRCGYSEQNSESRTPAFQRFACGVGHVINDIILQLLFSFRLVFFMKVLGLSAPNAGWLILYGLVALAAISPISACLVDKINIPFLSRKLGRRKSWHLIGTVLGAIIVPLYFSSCFVCQSYDQQWQIIVYVLTLNTFLALAVSLVEIGHLSVITVIAKDQSEVVELNAWRTGFTFLSGILTYFVAWGILGQDSSDDLSPKSSMDFTVMTLILTGIALIFAAIFHIGSKEPSETLANRRVIDFVESSEGVDRSTLSEESNGISNGGQSLHASKQQQSSEHEAAINNQDNSETPETDFGACFLRLPGSFGVDNLGCDCNEAKPDQVSDKNANEVHASEVLPKSLQIDGGVVSGTSTNRKGDLETVHPATPGPKTVRTWLKDVNLYKVGLIYTCAKVSQVVSYSYLPLVLTDRLKFGKEAIANLPLVMLISATISSGITKIIVGKIGTKWSFILAGLLVVGAASWCYFITQSTRVLIYPAAVLLGFGLSAMFVNALSFAAELIGDNKSTSGFVFAFMGLMSNLTAGALISAIQKLFPSDHESEDCDACVDYVRHVFSIVPGSLAAISLLVVLVFQTSQVTCKRNDYTVETEITTAAASSFKAKI